MTALHYLSATEALRLFRDRELSPVELMRAVLDRADEVEPAINAFCARYDDEALAAARAAEKRYADPKARVRPLEGVPVAIKDDLMVEGRPYTRGSLIFKDAVATRTAPAVERIVRGGGIVHGRTATPEFCVVGWTESLLNGLTRNPWNLDYSPGGSSGGSAAALAAGATLLATGSDIGGSIRAPASACGVVGYKPPYGRVPSLAPHNLDRYLSNGSLGRTVDDCALLQNVIAGPHPADIASLRPKLRIPKDLGGIEGWKIGYSPDLDAYRISDEVQRNTNASVDALREAGANVEEVSIGWDFADVYEAAGIHLRSLALADYARVLDQRNLMTPYARAAVEAVEQLAGGDSVLRGAELEGRLYEKVGPLLATHRALICPTMAIPAFDAGDDYLDHGPEVDGVALAAWWEAILTPAFNVLGRLPSMSVPSGRGANGVPTGLQIVTRSYDDIGAFRIARALERLRPGFADKGWRPPS